MAFDGDIAPVPAPEPAPEPAVGADGDYDDALAADAPDAVDDVVEVADMMAVFAAQRFVRVDRMRCEGLAEAGLYGSGIRDVAERSIRLELAMALRTTETAAGMLLGRAEALVHRYPVALESLWGARMTERHAEILVDAVDEVEPELRERIVPDAVALAEQHPVGSFRRALRRLIDTVRAVTLEARHAEAVQTRRVVVEAAGDAMAWVHMLVPAVEAHAIYGRATAIAKVLAAVDGEQRTLDQLRADVIGDLLIDGNTTTHPVHARGIRAVVAVTVPALALLGADGGLRDGAEPAAVEGVGPIPIGVARELCGGADGWMRVLTHPETGMVLSVGRDRYRPPEALARLVRWRAGRCMGPGCGMPAHRCQIDHNIAWEHGGPTALSNHAPFCVNHHVVKHHGGWTIRQLPGSGGAIEWTSPTGRVYLVRPERPVPVFTARPDTFATSRAPSSDAPNSAA